MQPTLITNDSPLSSRDRAVFVVLTAVAAAALFAFLAFVPWFNAEHPSVALIVFIPFMLFHFGCWLVRWLAIWRMQRPLPMRPDEGLRVAVATTFVPDAEPVGMLEQTLRALLALDYPHDTWVLDEGDDPQVAELCESLGARHWSRKKKHPHDVSGSYARDTKYGNYNAWLVEHGYANYDVIAAFDSDHIPEPTFLTRVLGFFRDPAIAFVQVPQVYYNHDASFIARGAAEETYGFYSVHEMASYGAGHPIIVGCHNTHRVAALQAVGGFSPHDADDLVLTLLYRAARWRGVYVPEILALGLTPVNWYDYLRQQVRWSKSVVEVKLRRLPALVGRLTLTDRILGIFHGVYYLRALALGVAYATVAALLLSGARPYFVQVPALLGMVSLALLGAVIGRFARRYYLDPGREGGVHWRATLLQFAKWPYQWLAVWRALVRGPVPYALTHKVARKQPRAWILWPHIVVAGAMGTALALGNLLHGVSLGITVLAVAMTLLPLGIAATEWLRFPPPWEPQRYAERRNQLSDLLGPAAWRGPERRRAVSDLPPSLRPAIERRRSVNAETAVVA
ncbi:MAG: glycosyltransferase family 2 protein [Gemmatimonadaceae bacterium]